MAELNQQRKIAVVNRSLDKVSGDSKAQMRVLIKARKLGIFDDVTTSQQIVDRKIGSPAMQKRAIDRVTKFQSSNLRPTRPVRDKSKPKSGIDVIKGIPRFAKETLQDFPSELRTKFAGKIAESVIPDVNPSPIEGPSRKKPQVPQGKIQVPGAVLPPQDITLDIQNPREITPSETPTNLNLISLPESAKKKLAEAKARKVVSSQKPTPGAVRAGRVSKVKTALEFLPPTPAETIIGLMGLKAIGKGAELGGKAIQSKPVQRAIKRTGKKLRPLIKSTTKFGKKIIDSKVIKSIRKSFDDGPDIPVDIVSVAGPVVGPMEMTKLAGVIVKNKKGGGIDIVRRVTRGELLSIKQEEYRNLRIKLPNIKKILVKDNKFNTAGKFFLSKEILDEAGQESERAGIPDQLKKNVSNVARSVVQAVSPDADPEVVLTRLSRIVMGNGIANTRKGKFVPVKNLPEGLIGSTVERQVRANIETRLASLDDRTIKLIANEITPVDKKVSGFIRSLYPDANVGTFIENLRRHAAPGSDIVDGTDAVIKFLKGPKGRSKQVLATLDSIASDMALTEPSGGGHFLIGSQGKKIAIIKSAEIERRATQATENGGYRELPGGLFNNIPNTLDKARGIDFIEGGIAKLGKRGAIRVKLDKLRNGILEASDSSTQAIKKLTEKYPNVKPGSVESELLSRFLSGTISLKELQTLQSFKFPIKQMREDMLKGYVNRIRRTNEVLEQMGVAPIPFRSNFGAHLTEIQMLDNFYGNIAFATEDDLVQAFINKDFSKEIFDKFGSSPQIEDDAIRGYHQFIRITDKIIHTFKPAKDVQLHGELISSKGLDLVTSGNFIEDIGHAILSPRSNVFGDLDGMLKGKGANMLANVNRNFIRSVIFANPSVIANQAFSASFVMQNAGFRNSIKGLHSMFDKRMVGMTDRLSVAVRARKKFGAEFDLGKLDTAIERTNFLLKKVDEGITSWAFMSGIHRGKQLGLKGRALIGYADDVATRANILYLKSDIPRVLRSQAMRLAFPIQTFTFNNMNNMRFDLMRGETLDQSSRFASALTFTGWNMAINTVQAMLGMNPGYGIEDNIPIMRSARFSDPSPFVRGSFRIGVVSEAIAVGTGIGRAVAEEDDDALERYLLSAAPLVTTIPGFAIIKRANADGNFSLFPLEASFGDMTLIPERREGAVREAVTLVPAGITEAMEERFGEYSGLQKLDELESRTTPREKFDERLQRNLFGGQRFQ